MKKLISSNNPNYSVNFLKISVKVHKIKFLGISIESSMRVIKRSMFMIGNWTGKLQSKIARKLVK